MVPDISHQAWRDLILEKKPIASSHFSFNLLLTTNRLFYQSDPTESHLAVLAEQLYSYMAKYESLYQDELQLIFGSDYTALFA